MQNEPITKEQEICIEIFNDESIPTYNYNGVEFKTNNLMMDESVKKQYIEVYQKKVDPLNIKWLVVNDDGVSDFVDVHYETEKVPFQRIRRITGYLVGTTDRWNAGKQAEERDRVKHN